MAEMSRSRVARGHQGGARPDTAGWEKVCGEEDVVGLELTTRQRVPMVEIEVTRSNRAVLDFTLSVLKYRSFIFFYFQVRVKEPSMGLM